MSSSLPVPVPATTSRLLLLPAEIRNKILEFALTSPSPLFHRQPKPRQTSRTASRHHRLIEAIHISSPTSHYHPEFNMLKFVNKQLHAETIGIELQFNAVRFQPYEVIPLSTTHLLLGTRARINKSAEQWLFAFAAPMTATKLFWLTSVVIDSRVTCLSMDQAKAPAMPDLPALVSFCKAHTHIDVKYLFKNWTLDAEEVYPSLDFLTAGVALTMAIRGDAEGGRARDEMLGTQVWVGMLLSEAVHWRETWSVGFLMKGVRNLRVGPMVRKTARERGRRNEVLGVGEERLDAWRRYAMAWVDAGICGV
jgi:hypothetical protein